MAKTIEVTAAQVNAARLLVKQASARGESVPPAVAAMANATPLDVARNGAQRAIDRPAASTTNGRVHYQSAATSATKSATKPARPGFAG
jgi:hypothetical protein